MIVDQLKIWFCAACESQRGLESMDLPARLKHKFNKGKGANIWLMSSAAQVTTKSWIAFSLLLQLDS